MIEERGYSLMEMITVIAILGLIVGIAVPLTLQTARNARAQNEVEMIYSNLSEARQRALQHNRLHMVRLAADGMTVYQDLNGDGVPQSNEMLSGLTFANPQYPLQGDVGGDAIGSTPLTIFISTRGLMEPTGTVLVPGNASKNCVAIGFTRVGVGRHDGNTCKVH